MRLRCRSIRRSWRSGACHGLPLHMVSEANGHCVRYRSCLQTRACDHGDRLTKDIQAYLGWLRALAGPTFLPDLRDKYRFHAGSRSWHSHPCCGDVRRSVLDQVVRAPISSRLFTIGPGLVDRSERRRNLRRTFSCLIANHKRLLQERGCTGAALKVLFGCPRCASARRSSGSPRRAARSRWQRPAGTAGS